MPNLPLIQARLSVAAWQLGRRSHPNHAQMAPNRGISFLPRLLPGRSRSRVAVRAGFSLLFLRHDLDRLCHRRRSPHERCLSVLRILCRLSRVATDPTPRRRALAISSRRATIHAAVARESRCSTPPDPSIITRRLSRQMTAAPNHALQRTAPCVTAPASTAAFPPAMQVPRRTPLSLSLRSLGPSSRPV